MYQEKGEKKEKINKKDSLVLFDYFYLLYLWGQKRQKKKKRVGGIPNIKVETDSNPLPFHPSKA